MQVKIIKKKRSIIPYLILLVVTFLATISYDTAKDSVSVEYSARTTNIGWTETRNSSSVKSTSSKASLDDNTEAFNALKIKLTRFILSHIRLFNSSKKAEDFFVQG